MFSPPVPLWKKWLMLAMIVSFFVLLAFVMHLRRSARNWDPNQARPTQTRPVR